MPALPKLQRDEIIQSGVESPLSAGVVLVVEDDPELRELLVLSLRDEGHRVVHAADGIAALEWLAQSTMRPDVVLADFNLPNGMDGLQLVARIRQTLQREVAAVILTGDISTGTLRDVMFENCVQLNKPVRLADLKDAIQGLIAASPVLPGIPAPSPVEAAGERGVR